MVNGYDGEIERRPWRWGTVDKSKRCTGGKTQRAGSITDESEEERRSKGDRSPPPRRKLEREASLGKRESGLGQKIWGSDGDTSS